MAGVADAFATLAGFLKKFRSEMSKTRTYHDEEVRQILELAIGQDDGHALLPDSGGGLTLQALHDVGRELGLPPHRISQAVAIYEGRGETVVRSKSFGLPTSLERTIPLPRALSEREWELLVAELRATFGVKGQVTAQGSLREWSHGTLHAFIEPTEAGYRLRITDSSFAIGGIVAGGLVLGFATMIYLVLLGKDDPGFKFAVPAFFALIGAGLTAASALSLPRWARTQERLMEQLARRTVTLLAAPANEADHSG